MKNHLQYFKLGDVELLSGSLLPDAFLAYRTYGILNANKKLSALEEAPNINAKSRSLA